MHKKPTIGPILYCQVCSSPHMELILAYHHHPRVHGHFTREGLQSPEIKYPLNFMRCDNCWLVQTNYAIDPRIVFSKDYPYHTGTTNMLVRNFRSLAEIVVHNYKLKNDDFVVDIGSNDGTLLQGFKEKGMQVLGVEPTDNAKYAREHGIPTLQKFFGPQVAKDIVKKYGQAKVVTAANVFAHVNDLYGLTQGIKTLIGKKGVFISESQYLRDIIEKLELDTIYDEHLRYYALKPMVRLFEEVGMSVIDAERTSSAGGSIRAYAMVGKHPLSKRAKDIIKEEEKCGLYKKETYRSFAKQALKAKYDLLEILVKCKKEGASIASLGAPGRSNTLLNFVGIDHHLLDYLCERHDSPKIGLFAPGSKIPIVDEIELLNRQPDYCLVLSWHIGEELMKKTRELGYKGTFIMPLPQARIVKKK